MNTSSYSKFPIVSEKTGMAALAGAVGGFAGFLLGEVVSNIIGYGKAVNITELIMSSAMWTAAVGIALGAIVLIFENWQSLRGRWDRDLINGLPLFLGLGFVGGAAGQGFYLITPNDLTRGVGWALMGCSIGAGIGILRKDAVQAQRGALGGALGGFIGGYIFNTIAEIIPYGDVGDGAISRAVGLIITGAVIGFLIRVVQDALKNAWLLCISSGPYEGKEYPLNTARVTVGASDTSDIALYREEWMSPQYGAFVAKDQQWWWQGGEVKINGVPQTSALLLPGFTLEFGRTQFRFQSRSSKSPSMNATPYIPPIPSAQGDAVSPISSFSPEAPRTVPMAAPVWILTSATGSQFRLPPAPAQSALGRASDNDISIGDNSVSSHHARLYVENDSIFITDIGSTNGTFINNRRIASNVKTQLYSNDKIKIGQKEYIINRSNVVT